jgi:beta-barrel assembly-enhancing protease
MRATLSKSVIAFIAGSLLLVAAESSRAQAPNDLPDIGSPASSVLTQNEEYQIGAMVVRQLREQGQILDDPETNEYLQALGSRIAAHASGENGQRFYFFVVRDSSINAFALPGGFIGINHGLMLMTNNEAQLASVLAHEVAHVTQRHIARRLQSQGRQSIAAAAAVLAAIVIGATTGAGGDAVQGAIAIAQGASAQQQINFTRANEYEADRVGIAFLAAAGFDPNAMPDFFETMGRRSGLAGRGVPELLRTHPVTTNRIAESRSRAAQIEPNVQPETLSYQLARERLRVIAGPSDADVRPYYETRMQARTLTAGERYGAALAGLAAGEGDQAVIQLRELAAQYPQLPMIQASLGAAQMQAGKEKDALNTFERALALSPRNVPLTVRYAEALLKSGNSKAAHSLLLDLFNNVAPTPEQIRLIALAASAAGDVGDAYFYMSEYHIAGGDLQLSMKQLELALASPNLTAVQRGRFQARLDEVREVVNRDRRRAQRETAKTPDKPEE